MLNDLRRSLPGLGALLAVLTMVAVIALSFGGRGEREPGVVDRGPPGPPSSYYFEARIRAEGADPARPPVDLVRSWFEAPNRWRWEYAYASNPDQSDSLQISDGQSVTTYSARTNTYQVRPAAAAQPPGRGLPMALFILGPLPADSLEAFLAQEEYSGHRRAGQDKILDRTVEVVEVDSGESKLTLWIDMKRLFVLRYLLGPGPSGRGAIEAEIVDLRYNQDIPAGVFSFEPPEGATEA